MDELISRDWVLKNMLFDVDRDVVRAAPGIDAEPVRHGEWIINNVIIDNNGRTAPDWPLCSKCRKKVDLEWDFCPHCGAKMDEEATHNEP